MDKALLDLLNMIAYSEPSSFYDGSGEDHRISWFVEQWIAAGYPGIPQGAPIPEGFDDLCLIEVMPEWRSGRGRFYRPKSDGYTDDPVQAGLYTGDEARAMVGRSGRIRAVLPEPSNV